MLLKIKTQRKKLKKFLMIRFNKIKIKMLSFQNLKNKQNKILMRSFFNKTNQNKLNKTN